MARTIPLSRGQFALVDDEDFDRVAAFKWLAKPVTRPVGKFYAARSISDPSRTTIYLHRFLLNPPPGVQVDHINRDGLDCRRSNLRLASQSLNSANSFHKVGVSGFRGVYKSGTFRWIARIEVGGRIIRGGSFLNAHDAAAAYDKLATLHFGEFATLNFPVELKSSP